MRFDDTSCPDTRIRYLTDGMLVREALVDPDLKRYKAWSWAQLGSMPLNWDLCRERPTVPPHGRRGAD